MCSKQHAYTLPQSEENPVSIERIREKKKGEQHQPADASKPSGKKLLCELVHAIVLLPNVESFAVVE